MGWLKKFRSKKAAEETATENDNPESTNPLLEELENAPVQVEKEKIDVRDDHARVAYLQRLNEAIVEAKRQCEDIKFEYGQVTSYLKDIQLLDQAPDEEKLRLLTAAQVIVELTKERRKLQKQEYKFTEPSAGRWRNMRKTYGKTLRNCKAMRICR